MMTMNDDDDSRRHEIIRLALEASERLYTDPAIKRFSPELEQKIAGKNHLFQGDFPVGRIRWVVSYPGQRGDFSLNKDGLLYLRTALEQGKIAAGIVVLKRGNMVANARPVAEVWPKLIHAVWMNYGTGDFCWVDDQFSPTTGNIGSGSRFIDNPDDAMPF
jgi:hypothetical protein